MPTGLLHVAHRGASDIAPENTLPAVVRALRRGADLVEVDVHRTCDGALVCVHDTTLARTTDARTVYPARGPWRVADLTLAEVRRLDAGAWFGAAHAGAVVPTLGEVARLCAGAGVGLLLELKAPHLYPGVVAEVAAEIGSWRSGPRVVVQSFDVAAVKEHHALAPSVPVGVLGRPPRSHLPALGSWASFLNPPHRTVSRRYVDEVHAAGMACLPWTADDPRAINRLLGAGVDGVITNRLDVLAAVPARVRA